MTKQDKEEILDFIAHLSNHIHEKIYCYPIDDKLKFEILQYIKIFIYENYPSFKEEMKGGVYTEICKCCNHLVSNPTIYSARISKKISPRPFADAIMYSFRLDVYFKDSILQFDVKED